MKIGFEITHISKTFKSLIYLIPLFILFILLKNGFDIYGDSHIRESSSLFPIPYDGTSAHYLPVMLYKYLDMSLISWIIFNFIVIVVFLSLVGLTFSSNFDYKKYFVFYSLFINSPSITIMFQQLGHYQIFYIIFAILFTAVDAKKLWIFFGIFMIMSSPEYSLISLVLIYFWGKAFSDIRYKQRVKYFITPAFILSVFNSWMMNQHEVASRIDAYGPNFQQSFLSFLSSGYLGVYAGFGSIWILIFYVLRFSKFPKYNLSYLIMIFLILIFFYATMADGTRIFVGLSSILLIPIIYKSIEVITENNMKIIALIFWILPNFVSEIGSPYFKVPFDFMNPSDLNKLFNLFG